MTIAENPLGTIFSLQDERDVESRAKRQRAYRSARRHSIVVKLLRWTLPVIGVVALAAVFAISWISTPQRFDITIAGQTVSVNGIVMDKPELTGFDDSNRRYRVSAESAIQNITSPDQIRLNNIEAEVTLPDEGSATITAGGGHFDNKAGLLQLIGGIAVDSTLGYRVSLKNADIDIKAGTLKSGNPVTIRYQDSEVTGDELIITERGDIVVLEGRVQTRIMPPKRNARVKADGKVKPGADAAAQPPGSIEELIERTN